MKEANEIAITKEWHDEIYEIGTMLAQVHSEALEADCKGDKENFVEELADVCIRVFDLSDLLNIDLELAISEKMLVNETRPYKHGKAY
ncbi:nucleotide pyrophosphohydrolase [Paenisporosarcina antarctica]|uniref:Nucleotide pyrophosphohydrolase n=2 Tax=Paenisporosarcina antarctica TaxID=417367 RepID=A0A4P7A4Q5_9BACL|nr:nucleotide pyrophosphohydrolase [Paenisporosarcina antarctica]